MSLVKAYNLPCLPFGLARSTAGQALQQIIKIKVKEERSDNLKNSGNEKV